MRARIEQLDAAHEAHVYEEDHANLRAVADHCAALRSAGDTGSGEMKHVARVPAILVQKYINDNGITFAQFMRDPKHAERLLADPAIAHFRVWEGRI